MKLNLEVLPLRIIKTVIAFFISVLLAPILHIDTFFAALGSLKSMSNSMTLSFHVVIEQMFSNLIAFLYAIVYTAIFGINVFSISFALLTLFISIKKMTFFDTYMSAAVTLIAFMMLATDQQDLMDNAFVRIVSTFFGMSIALIINFIIFKPKLSNDIDDTLQTINEYVHIYLNNNFEEYVFLQINEQLQRINKEKNIINEELKFMFNKSEKIKRLHSQLYELDIVEQQVATVFEITNLNKAMQDEMIPILLQLNYIKQYPNDKEEIIQIKKDIINIYNTHTTDDNFYTNTKFLTSLSDYIELLLDY